MARTNNSIAERRAPDMPGCALISSADTGFQQLQRDRSLWHHFRQHHGESLREGGLGKSATWRCIEQLTGLSASSSLPTIQSRAFFRTPGTPCAYSGTENTTPSAVFNFDRHSFTARGTATSSIMSGLKCGSSPSPSQRDISTPLGASVVAALRRFVLDELVRRLPDIARICMKRAPL